MVVPVSKEIGIAANPPTASSTKGMKLKKLLSHYKKIKNMRLIIDCDPVSYKHLTLPTTLL
ncbi:hypothetical protein, partial [Yersinia kristensenii]|uniref:hypothetical protein n=1 Tax=Yersinia kristensenii TaxID=28152 RepID=UPI0022FDD626